MTLLRLKREPTYYYFHKIIDGSILQIMTHLIAKVIHKLTYSLVNNALMNLFIELFSTKKGIKLPAILASV